MFEYKKGIYNGPRAKKKIRLTIHVLLKRLKQKMKIKKPPFFFFIMIFAVYLWLSKRNEFFIFK